MNHNLRKIQPKAPKFLSKIDSNEYYSDIPDGWLTLVENLCRTIEWHINFSVPQELQSQIFATQIKEKFGMLRIYCNQSTPFIDGALSLAETISEVTCQRCGNLGTKHSGPYIEVLCSSCLENKK
jgi:hypothetical protein